MACAQDRRMMVSRVRTWRQAGGREEVWGCYGVCTVGCEVWAGRRQGEAEQWGAAGLVGQLTNVWLLVRAKCLTSELMLTAAGVGQG